MKLTIGERINLNNLLGDYKGKLGGVYKIFKVLDKTNLTEKETKAANLKQTLNSQGNPMISWDAKKDISKEIVFTPDEIDLIKGLINDKSSRGEFTPNDRMLVNLAEKLGIELDEPEVQK